MLRRSIFKAEEGSQTKPRELHPLQQEASTSKKTASPPQGKNNATAIKVTTPSDASAHTTSSEALPENKSSAAVPKDSTPSAGSQVDSSSTKQQSEDTFPPQARSPSPKNKGKLPPILSKAFFNTVAPGLSLFAQTNLPELDVVVEESSDDEEEDPDVIAIVADF